MPLVLVLYDWSLSNSVPEHSSQLACCSEKHLSTDCSAVVALGVETHCQYVIVWQGVGLHDLTSPLSLQLPFTLCLFPCPSAWNLAAYSYIPRADLLSIQVAIVLVCSAGFGNEAGR